MPQDTDVQCLIEAENISRFEYLLSRGKNISEESRLFIQEQLLASKRRLAALTAVMAGLKPGIQLLREQIYPRCVPKLTARFQVQFELADQPLLLIDPGPGLHIVDVNKAYAAATMIKPGKVAGEKIFDVFPDNPGDPFADGVANLYDSLRIVAETGRSHVMPIQRYDVRDAAGRFVRRYWQALNSAILDEAGNVAFILHSVTDVTAQFAARDRSAGLRLARRMA
jgi:PAS domain-containing protein